MKKHIKTALLATSGAALLAGAPAMAQPAIEEIIVTARQRAESLQDVPASITVFTSDMLESAGVQRAEDFISMTPGVTMVNAAEVGDTQVNIRGINGARDAENSYALIIDGILHTNPAALNREYTDLQQIEVLKGPQGALYGRNAAAGAIIITTKRPSDTAEGLMRVSLAEDNTYYGSASYSGPLTGSVYGGLHADWRKTDGFYRNSFLGGKIVDDFENFNIGGRLVFEPSDTSSVDLKVHYGEVDAAAITFNAAFALPGFAALLGNPDFNEDVNKHAFVFQPNIDPQNDQESFEVSAKYESEMDWGTLTAWMLYSDIKNSFSADGTSGAFGFFNTEPTCLASVTALFNQGVTLPSPTFLGPNPNFPNSLLGPYTPTTCDGTQYQVRNQSDISAEIRIASPADQQLRWVAGAYFLDLNREVGINLGIDLGQGVTPGLYLPASSSNPTEALVDDDFDSTVYAAFGQVAYDMTDDLELAVAMRYDREERKVKSLIPTGARTQYLDYSLDGAYTGNAPLNPALDPSINPSGIIPPQSKDFEQLQPKVSLTWEPSDEWTFYANWGIGFKSGGFNNQGSAATVEVFFNQPLGTDIQISDQFRKEKSSAFEAGFKSSLMDGRLSVQGAGYYTQVDDMQFFEFLVGPFGLLRVVNNIDEITLKGVEVGFAAAVNDNFSIYGGANMTDSEIKRMVSRPDTVGNKSPYTADYTLNFGAEMVVPVSGDIELFSRADWNMVGPTWFHVVQCQDRPTLFGAPSSGCNQQRGSYSTLDLRAGFQTDVWSLIAFANNVGNKKYLEEVIPAPEFGGSFIHPGSLRRFGVEASYRF